jgi:hypothetical protein
VEAPLRISAYYIRPNAIAQALPQKARDVFLHFWEAYADHPLKGAHRAALGGDVASMIIKVGAVPPLSAIMDPAPGTWFTHLGGAVFKPPVGANPGQVKITDSLNDRQLLGVIRSDCMITSTARTNMSGNRQGEAILGVFKGGQEFELVACGYVNRLGDLMLGDSDAAISELNHWPNVPKELLDVPLAEILKESFEEMSEALRFRKGARLVGSGQSPRESSLQDLYYIIAPFVLTPYGGRLSREAGTGFGNVDFQVERGRETHLLEFKLWRVGSGISELRKGLTVQLPTYVEDMKAQRGWFVVFAYGDTEDDDALQNLFDSLTPHTQPGRINVVVLDARYQHPASKRATPVQRSARNYIVEDPLL